MRDTSPPNQQAFSRQVWSMVRQVPRGKVVIYSQIARTLSSPVEMDLQTDPSTQFLLGGQRQCGLSRAGLNNRLSDSVVGCANRVGPWCLARHMNLSSH